MLTRRSTEAMIHEAHALLGIAYANKRQREGNTAAYEKNIIFAWNHIWRATSALQRGIANKIIGEIDKYKVSGIITEENCLISTDVFHNQYAEFVASIRNAVKLEESIEQRKGRVPNERLSLDLLHKYIDANEVGLRLLRQIDHYKIAPAHFLRSQSGGLLTSPFVQGVVGGFAFLFLMWVLSNVVENITF